MRHAKAEAFAGEDHARELTDRGRRDAVEAGRWLRAQDVVPDHVFVSSAARTRGTWEQVARGLQAKPGALPAGGPQVVVEDALYAANPENVFEVLRTAPADAETVMVVGHNPTVAYVAHLLDDGHPDPTAFRDMGEGYPTAALTVLDVAVPWDELAEGSCHIAAFHVGDDTAGG